MTHDDPHPLDTGELALDAAHGVALRTVAFESIAFGVEHRKPLPVRAADHPEALRVTAATFVTLYTLEGLRGCIGAIQATRPLVEDVALHAFAAAFKDPRFEPVARHELPGLSIHISILGRPRAMSVASEQDLLRQLEPGVDGLIIEERRGLSTRRGTFLPDVWDHLPDPARFVTQLKLKAGMPADHWSSDIRVWRYRTVKVEA